MDEQTPGNHPQKWQRLYQTAGYATIAMLGIIILQILVFITSPMPTGIEDWFTLFRSNWFLGLVHLDALYLINNIIVAIMYLAFYVTLKPRHESQTTLAVMLGWLGIAAYLASNRAFEMLRLSRLLESAGSDAEKAIMLAAGQAVLLEWQGTAFLSYYVLNGLALIILSFVMLKNPVFGKATAVIGLIAGFLMVVPSTAGTIGLIFSLASLIPWYVFSIRVAKKFIQLGHQRPGKEMQDDTKMA